MFDFTTLVLKIGSMIALLGIVSCVTGRTLQVHVYRYPDEMRCSNMCMRCRVS